LLDTLARGHLAARVLGSDTLLPAAGFSLRLSPAQVIDAILHARHVTVCQRGEAANEHS
jgi:hypothetical protein